MSSQVLLFSALFTVAVGFFLLSCYLRFSLVAIGKPDNRFNEIGRRFSNTGNGRWFKR